MANRRQFITDILAACGIGSQVASLYDEQRGRAVIIKAGTRNLARDPLRSPQPADEYEAYVEQEQRAVAQSLGVAYDVLVADLREANYSHYREAARRAWWKGAV